VLVSTFNFLSKIKEGRVSILPFSSMAKNIFRIPLYLKARSEDDLVRAMLKNNLEKKKEFEYYSIYRTNNGVIAWYYNTVTVKDSNDPRKQSLEG